MPKRTANVQILAVEDGRSFNTKKKKVLSIYFFSPGVCV
jgi:hypothetical protein